MAIKTLKYSMPRGDSRTLPIAVPLATYSVGASLFFAIKPDVDNDLADATAAFKTELTDADITSTDADNVNYLLTLAPANTNTITPGVYRAEIEFVSADKSVVITFPDPAKQIWEFTITGDINRRTT
jgi:hypothetical protein